MLFISFHCAMFIWVHLDSQISGARVLIAVNCCYLSELEDLLFFVAIDLCILWAWALHVFLMYAMPSLQRCMPCIFVIYVVTSTSMETRLRDISDFRDCNFTVCLLLFCCYVSMCLQRVPCLFWVCSVRMFCSYSCNWSITAFVCNYGVP